MKNQIQKITHDVFGVIRMTLIEDKAWFCLSDVCKALSLTNPAAVKQRLIKRGISSIYTPTGNQHVKNVFQDLIYVNESNLYRCIFQSRKAEAEQFQDWVFDEVLPQIRQTGGYIPTHAADGDLLTPGKIIAQAQKIVQNTIDYQTKQLEEMQQKLIEQEPKVLFAEAVEETENSIYIGELAKLLTRNGYKIAQNQLFSWLRNNGYLFKRSTMPIQKWVVKGYFTVHVSLYEDSRGRLYETVVTKVTGKGQLYFINLLINKNIS